MFKIQQGADIVILSLAPSFGDTIASRNNFRPRSSSRLIRHLKRTLQLAGIIILLLDGKLSRVIDNSITFSVST